jgi:hypothetical protein
MVTQFDALRRDVTDIKVGVARIEEHMVIVKEDTNKNCMDIQELQKFNYKLVGAAAVCFFILDLGIKIIFKI